LLEEVKAASPRFDKKRKSHVAQIRKRLQTFFRIDSDPFIFRRQSQLYKGGWTLKLKLLDERGKAANNLHRPTAPDLIPFDDGISYGQEDDTFNIVHRDWEGKDRGDEADQWLEENDPELR
jgi:hypothetical protein